MMIYGSLLNIKKNIFNTTLTISSYIDGFYIKRYIYLYSNLLIFILNQQDKRLLSEIKLCKNKFINKKNLFSFEFKEFEFFFKFYPFIKAIFIQKYTYIEQ